MACFAWAKLPDVIAFSKAVLTEFEPDCSVLTSLHIALLGFDPLVDVEWFFAFWMVAEAAVSGARDNVRPSTPAQIPSHFDRCSTVATSMSRTRSQTLQHPFRLHGDGWGRVTGCTVVGLNRQRAGVMVAADGASETGGTRWTI